MRHVLYAAMASTTELIYQVGLVESRKDKNEGQGTGDIFLMPNGEEIFVGVHDRRDQVTILKWIDRATGEERRRHTLDSPTVSPSVMMVLESLALHRLVNHISGMRKPLN